MSQKLGSLSVKIGEYTDNQGNTKGRYVNAGVLMQGDDGGYYVLINKTFNPAGVNQGDGKESVLLSCYADNNQNQQNNQNQGNQQQGYNQQNNYQQPQQGYNNQQNQGYNQNIPVEHQ